jgi:hypothetical protein
MLKVVRLGFALAALLPAEAQAQSMLFRVNSTVAGPVSEVSAASINDEQFVTGDVNGKGLLTMTAWNVTQNGTFTKQGVKTANGSTPQFVLVNTGTTGVVSVVKTTDDNGALKLIDWTVSANGAIARAGSIEAGPITTLAAAAVGDTRIVTATQHGTSPTELIIWDLNANGTFTRRGNILTSAGSAVAVAVLSPTVVASAIRNKAGNLEVGTFSLTAGGTLTALGAPVTGTAISTVSTAGTSLDRFVTATRLANGDMDVSIWTSSASGPVLSSHETAGNATDISVKALTGVKAVTAFKQQGGTLGLITWKVSGNIERLSKVAAGPVGPIAMAILGWDRIVTPVQEKSGNLDIIDWGDASVGMLQTTWDKNSPAAPANTLCGNTSTGPMGGAPFHPVPAMQEINGSFDDEDLPGFSSIAMPAATVHPVLNEKPAMILSGPANPPDPPSPSPTLTFHPDIPGVDPMIAVGKQYVIVTEDHWIEFYPKSGTPTVSQLPSNGAPTCLTSTQFFAGFTRPLNGDGSVNRSNIDLYGRFPANTGAIPITLNGQPAQLNLQCDPTDPSLPSPCINEFYDTRVTYDPYTGHFIIVSQARGVGLGGAIQQEEIARRYIAIAVSKDEDPRDGFNQFITTESSYLDWPYVATANGVIVTSHHGCVDADTGPICDNDALENVPLSGRHQRPAADVYNIADMAAAVAGDSPRNWKIESYAVGEGTYVPVTHHGSVPGGWTYLAHMDANGLTLWGFVQPATWDSQPALKSASSTFTGGMAGFVDGVTYQNNNLYFAGADSVANRSPDHYPERWRVRGMRLEVSSTSSHFDIANCPASNCLDFTFGQQDADDATNDLLSYEMPSMAVDAAGDMVIVHGRVPIVVATTKGQETRYRVYYSDNRALQGGTVLNLGSPLLTDKFCTGGVTESQATADSFYHVQYAVAGGCPTQRYFQDYGSAFSDPDGKHVWMAHAFAAPGGYTMVAGEVQP